MRDTFRYRLAVISCLWKGEAGFWGALISVGASVLGSVLGGGKQQQQQQPTYTPPPPPPESGMGKMLPWIVAGGFGVVLILVVLLFAFKK